MDNIIYFLVGIFEKKTSMKGFYDRGSLDFIAIDVKLTFFCDKFNGFIKFDFFILKILITFLTKLFN